MTCAVKVTEFPKSAGLGNAERAVTLATGVMVCVSASVLEEKPPVGM